MIVLQISDPALQGTHDYTMKADSHSLHIGILCAVILGMITFLFWKTILMQDFIMTDTESIESEEGYTL